MDTETLSVIKTVLLKRLPEIWPTLYLLLDCLHHRTLSGCADGPLHPSIHMLYLGNNKYCIRCKPRTEVFRQGHVLKPEKIRSLYGLAISKVWTCLIICQYKLFAPSLLPKIQLLLTVASLRSESQSRCLIWQTWEKSIDSCLVHVRQLLQESWIPQYWKSESKIFIIQWHNNSRQWPSKIAKTRQSTGKQVELPQVHEQQAVTWIGDNIMCTKSRLDVIT